MLSEQGKKIIEAYYSFNQFDFSTKLQSNRTLVVGGKTLAKIDTIYISRCRGERYASLLGEAHDDSGDYNWDLLISDEISNLNINEYMQNTYITNFEAFIIYLDKNKML